MFQVRKGKNETQVTLFFNPETGFPYLTQAESTVDTYWADPITDQYKSSDLLRFHPGLVHFLRPLGGSLIDFVWDTGYSFGSTLSQNS